jgi:hypothetical protein
MKSTMLLCAALAAAVFLSKAHADEWNKKTFVTFSEPVEIPGVVLEPGEYVLKLMDTMADRNVVQIFNKDESHIYATILAIPDYRMQPSDKTVISFEERAAGSPEAVKAWFYPGDNYGQAFVYPRSKALELAKANHQPVPSMPSETAGMTKPAEPPSQANMTALKKAPIKAAQPKGQETEVSQAIQTHPTAEAPARQPVESAAVQPPVRQLPRTASPMPLVGLLGLLSAAAALAVRSAARRCNA